MSEVMVRAETCVRCGYRTKEREEVVFIPNDETTPDEHFGNDGDVYCVKCAIVDGLIR